MDGTARTGDRNRRFEGRRIYLTGAASGIGLATARQLAGEGAALALVDIDGAALQAAARATSGHCLTVDLTDGAAVDRSVAAAAEMLGGLDGVINCAGVGEGAGLAALDPQTWARTMAINLDAPYRVCRAALPFLTGEPHAAIVNVASGEALLPTSTGAAAYAASKGGLIAFTKALAAGLAPSIRANVVCPGLTDTPMTAAVLHDPDHPEAAANFAARYAMKRAADPAEIAEAIAFLASHEASYVTGVTFAADGGRTFH